MFTINVLNLQDICVKLIYIHTKDNKFEKVVCRKISIRSNLYNKKIVAYMVNDLIINLDKLHTTEMGIDRIKRNLQIDLEDVVKYCYDKILSDTATIYRKGKNWYIITDNCKITVNAHSYTIITAHKTVK